MSSANVQVDALRDFRVALVKFIETAGMSLADADSDIARTLNCPIGTVLARAHRALGKLRSLMEVSHGQPESKAEGSARTLR